MPKAGVPRYAWLLCNRRSFHAVSPNLTTPTLPTHSAPHTTTKMAEFSSAAAAVHVLIFNRGFCSDANASDSGNLKLGRKDRSRTELTALLESYGFSQVQIDDIIKKNPYILTCRVSTNLRHKLDFFVECGFSSSALCTVFTSNPRAFTAGLDSSLKPRYQFLKTYLKDKVNEVLKRHSRILCSHNAETNVEYLKKQGVPHSSIAKLLMIDPRLLGNGKNNLVNWVEATKELGIKPSAPMFVWYVRMFGSMNETSWKKKVELFKSLGWSDEDIRATLLHYPTCLAASEEKLRGNMDFYIKNVKMDPRDVIGRPILLQYSLTGRIIPRYEVMKLLKEYNLLKSCKMTAFFGVSEKRFISMYIEKNVEKVPHLLHVYCDSKKPKADAAKLCS